MKSSSLSRRRNESEEARDESPGPEEGDEAIIKRVMNEDINDYELLVRRYKRFVFALVSRRIPLGNLADVAQQVFVDAYRSLSRYRANPKDGKSFKNWLARIATRRCADYWRGVARHPASSMDTLDAGNVNQLEALIAADGRISSLDDQEWRNSQGERDERELLRGAMDALREEDRRILDMLHFEGRSVLDIAAVMDKRPGCIRVRAHRARESLRELIAGMTLSDQAAARDGATAQ